MSIPDLNLIGDFEAGIKCLQNPSLIPNLSAINKLPQFHSFWTWGALILAVFATFTSVFNKIKLFVYRICRIVFGYFETIPPEQVFDDDDFDFDFSDDGDDDTPSSAAETDDDELDSENDRGVRGGEVFRAEGWRNREDEEAREYTLRRRNGFSWSDFSAGKSVVQLWDSFGLGLDFEDDESESEIGSEIAIWDLDRDVKISSGRRLTAAPAAENVVLTAEMSGSNGGVGFGAYDSRVDGESPAIYAAWRPRRRTVWADGGGQKEE